MKRYVLREDLPIILPQWKCIPRSRCVSEFPTLRLLLRLLLLLILWMTVTWNPNSVLCLPHSFSRDQRNEEDIRNSSVVPCCAPSLFAPTHLPLFLYLSPTLHDDVS